MPVRGNFKILHRLYKFHYFPLDKCVHQLELEEDRFPSVLAVISMSNQSQDAGRVNHKSIVFSPNFRYFPLYAIPAAQSFPPDFRLLSTLFPHMYYSFHKFSAKFHTFSIKFHQISKKHSLQISVSFPIGREVTKASPRSARCARGCAAPSRFTGNCCRAASGSRCAP